MEKNSLTFLSSRGTGLNSDLKLIQSVMTRSCLDDNFSYRFFLKNERSTNPLANQGYNRAKKEFCVDMENVICSDASLSSDIKNLQETAVRLLLAVPYEYQFKNMLAFIRRKGERREWKTFRNFTHIVPGSPFTRELFEHSYALTETVMLDHICMPFIWEINQQENQLWKREQLEFYFPAAQGKKIFSILLYGEANKRRWLDQFNMQELIEMLGPDWFVITNQPDIMEETYNMNAEYAEFFGYVNRIMPVQDLLYVSDFMVTNNGRFASYFVSRRKPVYCLNFRGNHFENYMKECHPELFLETLPHILRINRNNLDWSEELQRFYDQMVFQELICPYDTILDLFGFAE